MIDAQTLRVLADRIMIELAKGASQIGRMNPYAVRQLREADWRHSVFMNNVPGPA